MSENLRDELFNNPKNGYDRISEDEKAKIFNYCEDYKTFLDLSKTERLCVKESIKQAENAGFVEYKQGMALPVGTKIYKSHKDKSMFLAVIGEESLANGMTIAAAHIDSPRLDLKQNPMYEDNGLCYFKTHYFGGIKKYQWLTLPLELHGVIVLKDGTVKEFSVGNEANDPQFMITDLLPHLGADQAKKTLGEAITGESLNILIGSIPDAEEGSDRVKFAILKMLNEKYGMTETDFLSAEISAVPALNARDHGFDRSMIAGYGHDDRVCAYAQLRAILETEKPRRTTICVLADKEETGSDGITGMQSMAFDHFVEDLCDTQNVKLRHCFENSICLSADVSNAFDPNFPEVSEKRNNSYMNFGVTLLKYSGSRGKSGTSDATAEVVGFFRKILDENEVIWQMGQLGKVDQGGGGTVAKYMANRNIETLDAGTPVLSMHAPYELVSKLDCYMTYKAVKAMINS